jgi:putative phage-type endonuclease
MPEIKVQQRSPEWYQACCGSLGSSSIADVIATTKTGWGASRKNVMARLTVERLTNQRTDSAFTNTSIEWGVEQEPNAREAYEFLTGNTVVETGLYTHPHIAHSHASPDGLIGDDGLIELKCPNTATHIETLLSEAIPAKYITQMTWQMACTGRQWVDYVSFDPRVPPKMQLFIKRVRRDDKAIAELEKQVQEFLQELEHQLSKIRMKFP